MGLVMNELSIYFINNIDGIKNPQEASLTKRKKFPKLQAFSQPRGI
jgi:hypothetical protein